jgi:PAS domain S-box-containing protein
MNAPGYSNLSAVHEGSDSVIYRAVNNSGLSVIIKAIREERPPAALIDRYKHEYEITRGIQSEGVVKVREIERTGPAVFLVFEDFGGESLGDIIARRRFSVREFLEAGIRICRALHDVHSSGVVHRDINPSNIVCNLETGELKLIDFGIAAAIAGEQSLDAAGRLEGTLGYISPEQTGRMNRRADWRADLYSLGATFYEMLTGRRPFEKSDLQELIHDHIARQPVAPVRINTLLPTVLSDIVMKLLAKNADDRYQSAVGVAADLEECLRRLTGSGIIEPFDIGLKDVSERFVLPSKLYGREAEISLLISSLEKIGAGRRQMLLVSGAPGVGKTSLIREMQDLVIEKRGYFITSKFDQFVRNTPYSAVIGAFRELMNQLLAESNESLAQWRAKILGALGPNGRVLIDLIPELELVIGSQPPVAVLQPEAAQNRFRIVFYDFLALFCRREHPLVIFLDDLQWADLSSLGLIETMMGVDEGALMLICAYRDNEVDETHPFMNTLKRIPDELKARLELGPLAAGHIEGMIADMVRRPPAEIEPLSALVHKKTGGNPFFVGEFLKTVYSENLLAFNVRDYRWQWDLGEINAKGFTDNVVDLVIGNIRKLPGETQKLLRYASMLGNIFDVGKLSILSGRPQVDIIRNLSATVHDGFLVQLNNARYSFAHDRIQQGAYGMVPPADREAEHLRAGRLLLAGIAEEKRGENLFVIVDQLNKSRGLILEDREKALAAGLNYQAGLKAKESAAYAPAYQFFRTGIDMLQGSPWQNDYDFTLAVHSEAAEAAYLAADHDEMERLGGIILRNARTAVDKVPFYISKVNALNSLGRNLEALDMGLEVLDGFGIRIPRKPKKVHILTAFLKADSQVRGKTPEEIASFPEATDPRMLAILRLMDNLVASAYSTSPDILALLDFKAVYLLAKNRISCRSSRILWGVYAEVFLIGVMNKVQRGSELARVGNDLLAARPDARASDAVMQFASGCFLLHRVDHLRTCFEPCLKAFQSGLESGSLHYSGIGIFTLEKFLFLAGVELSEIERTLAQYVPAMIRIKHEKGLYGVQMRRQSILNLQGLSADPCVLSGEFYREEETLPMFRQRVDVSILFDAYLTKMILCYLFGLLEEAREISLTAEKYLKGQPGQVAFGFYHFYDSLIHLADIEGKSARERRAVLKRIDRNQKVLKTWGRHAPMNYGHKILLVEAELSRVSGKAQAARDYYDQAISLAAENKYLHEQAIACELAGRHCLSRGKSKDAADYLGEARYLYERWGASAKVRKLAERYQDLLIKKPDAVQASASSTRSESSSSAAAFRFDLDTVVKAAGAISREIRLEKLLAELIKIIMENAGAQRGFLILNNEGRLTIEARGSIESSEEPVPGPVALDASDRLSPAMVRYVERTMKTLVLADAAREGGFTQDEYVRRARPRSVLCMPLVNKAALTGVLYLENNIAAGAFTDERVELLGILASQAAISIENARLYSKLRDSESRYRGLYENAVEGIFQFSPEGKLLSCNASTAGIMGFDSPGQMLAKAGNVFEAYVDPGERDEMLRQLHDNGQVIGFETRMDRRGGKIIWVSISARTVRDADGALLCYEGSLIDISAQKEKEMERREREAAEAASRAKGEFLARMSHEIRTPMNAIIGMTQLALDGDLPEKEREYVRVAGSSAHSLLGLINDILDFSKIEAGKLDIEAVELSIADIMESIPDMFGHAAAEKGLELITDIDPRLPRALMGDPLRLRQVLINLVGNAVKFTDRGEIAVSVRPAEDRGDSLALCFAVRDSGIGISPDKASRLFDNFSQADESISRRYGGTGLGLAISRKLVELMGGTISMESQPAAGSTFRFTVPLRKCPDSAPIAFERISNGQKALVLSGSEALSAALCRDLGLYGIAAQGTRSVEEAAGRLRDSEDIKIVFIDCAISGDMLSVVEDLRIETQYAVFILMAPAHLETGPQVKRYLAAALDKPVKRSSLPGVLRKLGAVKGHGRGHGPGHILIDLAKEKSAEPQDTTYGGKLRGLRVLMVEDNTINQMLGRIVLEGAGLIVEIADNGLRAVEKLRDGGEAFDVVLMDVQMPEMDGYEATREIRRMAEFASLPIIAMTANALKGDRELCLEAGMNDYISKPINREELFSTIEKWSASSGNIQGGEIS